MSEESESGSLGRRMGKGRLEAFTDGVVAIIITIMVLELKTPVGAQWPDLMAVMPTLGLYAVSFVYVAIYWNNHHHLMHVVHRVTGGVLWANMHLLFWLSLVPFSTRWMGEDFQALPVAVYGVTLIMPAIAYTVLLRLLIHANGGSDGALARAIGPDIKGYASLVLYAIGIVLAFFQAWAAVACYALVACIWLIPDRRIERD